MKMRRTIFIILGLLLHAVLFLLEVRYLVIPSLFSIILIALIVYDVLIIAIFFKVVYRFFMKNDSSQSRFKITKGWAIFFSIFLSLVLCMFFYLVIIIQYLFNTPGFFGSYVQCIKIKSSNTVFHIYRDDFLFKNTIIHTGSCRTLLADKDVFFDLWGSDSTLKVYDKYDSIIFVTSKDSCSYNVASWKFKDL